MKKGKDFTKESFEALLAWLDPDREAAGLKYELIRFNLIRIFVRRGCHSAEDLADETINRGIQKIPALLDTYQGNPALYFYGIARIVYLESLKRKFSPLPAELPNPLEDIEDDYPCLEKCLKQLSPESRWLILEYYRENTRTKIEHRKFLAEQLRITSHNLTMRIRRIKDSLKDCILKCTEDE